MSPQFQYLVSGRSPGGRKVATIVLAESGDEAVQAFESQGNTHVVLHTDDVAAPPATKELPEKRIFTPLEEAMLPTMGQWHRFGFVMSKAYRSTWQATVPAILIAATAIILDISLLGFEYLAAAWLFFPLVISLWVIWFSAASKFRRLLRAIGTAQWERALRLIPRIAAAKSTHELALLKARALAGLGRLAEALHEIDRIADDSEIPQHFYWLAQATVYQDAGEQAKVLDALTRAHEIAPNMNFIMISLANRVLSVRRDVRRARELLTEARKHVVSSPTVKFLLYAEGYLALEEGRSADAVELLDDAAQQMDVYCSWEPSLLGVGARMRARLCLACAAAGDTAPPAGIFVERPPCWLLTTSMTCSNSASKRSASRTR